MFALACASANFVVAIREAGNGPARLRATTNIRGPQAAAAGWPDGAEGDWPAVSAWSESRTIAFCEQQAWGHDASGSTTHGKNVQFYGWPLAVISRTRRWWPDMPAGSASNPDHDSGMQLKWAGAIVNPIAGAAGLWTLFVVPFLLLRSRRVATRRRLAQCVACGYPLGASGICPECGSATHLTREAAREGVTESFRGGAAETRHTLPAMTTADIDRYESQAAELHRWVDGLTAADLDAHPVPGTWSMRELLAHMLDSDLVYGHRMRKVAAEKRPLMMGYDETLWAATPALQVGDAHTIATIFELHRRWIASFLRALPVEAWSREGIHSERGVVTIATLLSSMLNHVTHHARFVEAKRQKLGKPMKVS